MQLKFGEKLAMAECAVCHQNTPKTRVHYGGVSCYSCRAFFRRNTQRVEVPPCKERRECDITYTDRKVCTYCRYQKCIRVGMIPSLVLNENDKRIRFKKLHQKKKQELDNFRNSEETENYNISQTMGNNLLGAYSEEEEEEESDDNQAQNYTQAFLTIQQRRSDYLHQLRGNVEEETSKDSSDDSLASTSLKSEYTTLATKSNRDVSGPFSALDNLTKSNLAETGSLSALKEQYMLTIENSQRLQQLLELSHKAAIFNKMKDTDFPRIIEKARVSNSEEPKTDAESQKHETDSLSSDEEDKAYQSDEGPVTSRKISYPSIVPNPDCEERTGYNSAGLIAHKYHHKKFRTFQEQSGFEENRKRKSVIVQGPNCKRSCTV